MMHQDSKRRIEVLLQGFMNGGAGFRRLGNNGCQVSIVIAKARFGAQYPV